MCDIGCLEDVIELKQLLLRKQRTYGNQVQNPELRAALSEGAQLEEHQLELLTGELNRLRRMGGT
jgi:hypothetical protein